MKHLLKSIFFIFVIFVLNACQHDDKASIKIGIVVPIEHVAMQEIVSGFSETLKTLYKEPVKIKVANAQGDANLQRAIIQQMRDQNYTLIIPIGLSTTQMTLSIVKTLPVLSLAADISEKDRQQQKPCHIAVVHDEISPEQLLAFIHEVYPNLKHLTLIHSSSEKVYPQVQAVMASSKKYNLTIKPIMVSTLPDLYASANALPSQTEGIFVLKDHLIVSGIETLAKVAEMRHLPLITSDEGSVKAGAGFALGVREREIGVQGAQLAAQILQGKSACSLPIEEMKDLTVFINVNALKKEGQSVESIEAAGKKLRYKMLRSPSF